MTLSIIGTPGAANAASITLPTHAVGDLIVIFAYRSNSTTLPTKPTAGGTVPAWVDIDAPAGSNSCSGRSAQFVATATNHTSGTWTNATSMAVIVIRGQDPSLIGGHALSGGSSANQAVAPAITLTETNGTSMILEFYGQGSAGFQNNDWDAAPAGYTRRAATTQSFGPTRSCLNTKDVTTTDGAVNQTGSTNGFASNYQCATIEILDLIPPISFRYFFKGYGYVEQPVVPFNVENINRADKDIPDNAVGCYVTLIGGGGAGGDAHPSSGSGGGGGGGGGARIDRIYIPVASLGSTYSVNRGFGSTVVSAGGSASTFTSGSISLSAGGGGGGTTPGVAGASTGGAGGTASVAGVYATGYSGTAGGGDTYSANGQPGTDNTTNAGAGGGAGGSYAASWYTGGDGGDSSNATGAAGGTSGVHDGATPSSAGAGNGGAGGGGGVGALNTVDTGGGGAGGLYGGGGGGGGGGFNGNPNSFGFGGDGYSLVEWVDAGGAPQILSDDFNRSSLGANWTTRNGTLAMYNTDEVYPSVAGYGVATHVTTMDSDDMHVSVNIGTRAGNGGFAGVILGANSSGSEFVVLAISGTGINTASIYTCTQWDLSGGYTFRATNTISHDTGDNVGLKRVGNVYTVTMNGENTNITWTDSGDIVPRDSSHRHVGFFSDNNGDYWRFDDWEAIDLQ